MKKESPKDKTTMTAREVAVLIEDLRSQFRIFGKDLTAVKNKLDALYEEVGRQREEIFGIKADINVMKSDINILKADVAAIKKDVAEIKLLLKSHDDRLTRLEALK